MGITVEDFEQFLNDKIRFCKDMEQQSGTEYAKNYWSGRIEAYEQVLIEYKKILPPHTTLN